MADPAPTSPEFLGKYQKDAVHATWEATGIFSGVAYGSGLLIRPFAPSTAGGVAQYGSATHLPPSTVKGAAYPRAGPAILFNAFPAPGWIVPPEVVGLSPGYLVAPGEFGGTISPALQLAGIEPTAERAEQARAVKADAIAVQQIAMYRVTPTPLLIDLHNRLNSADIAQQNPNIRPPELSAFVFAELLRRGVTTVTPANPFEAGLLQQRLPVVAPPANPPVGIFPGEVPGTSAPLPSSTNHISGASGIGGDLVAFGSSQPILNRPANEHAIANANAATGIRRELATEKFDP